MRVEWGVATHTGRVRRINQDSVLAEPPVFLVADGMGGHAAGEVASAIAVEVLGTSLGASPTTVAQVVNAVRTANIEILRQAYEDDSRRGMGTTVTGVALVTDDGEEELAVVNVGDSRTYLFRDREIAQITRDHTYVEDLVAAGEISAEAARSHPQRHILTRVLGVDPDIEVDLWIFKPVAGDRYLVCSDGLPNEVDDDAMATVLREAPDPQVVCDELLRMALEYGGRDNVTVIVLDVLEGEALRPDGTTASAAPAPPASPAPTDGKPAVAEAATVTAAAVASAGTKADEPSAALDAALQPTTQDDRPSETMPLPVTPLVAAPPAPTASGLPPPVAPVGGWLGDHPFDVPDAPVPPESRPDDVTEPATHSLADAPVTLTATATVPAAEAPAAPPPDKAKRRKRRRRIGMATLVTLLALIVLAGIAVGGILYYGRTGYFVAFSDDDSVAVFQGRVDGVLWVQPTMEVVYPLQRDDLEEGWQERIAATIEFSSLDAADRWYQALSSNPEAVPSLATTTTVAPTTAAPTTAATSVSGSSSSTVPGP